MRWSSVLRGLFARRTMDRELDEELRFHLQMEAAHQQRAGASAADAARQARLRFGGVERYREAAIEARRLALVATFAHDLRQGWRSLRRAPGFTLAAVLMLALGIGAATAAFSVIDGVLLRPLVYPDAERLYVAREQSSQGGLRPPSYPAVRDWQERTRAFSGISYVRGEEFLAREASGTLQLLAGYATREFFRTLATPALLGRTFDERDAQANVAVIAHHAWQGSFGGAPDILGRTLTTPDGSYVVIGVMPPGFRAPVWADVWLPVEALPAAAAYVLTERGLHADAEVYVRVRPDVDAAAAKADLDRVVAQLAEEYADLEGTWREAALTLERDRLLGNSANTPRAQSAAMQLRVLSLAVLLVLLIACVNVASLQLARGVARARELAVRSTLGAGRARLVAQLLTENVLLAAIGGSLGIAAAYVAVRAIARALPNLLPRMTEVRIDERALLVAAALTLLAALLSGVAPALRAAAPQLASTLRQGAGPGLLRSALRLRSALVVVQIALACVLVVGAGLLLQSLARVQAVPLGFATEHRVALRVFPPSRYAEPQAAAALYARLQQAVRAVPGVSDAALVNHLPLAGGAMPTPVEIGPRPAEAAPLALERTISPAYLGVMGTRLLQGRALGDADLNTGGSVLVNAAFVRTLLAAGQPLGRSITIHRMAQGRPDFGEPLPATIVGVVEDERFYDVQGEVPPMVFVPYTAVVWPNIFVVARTKVAPAQLLPELRRAISAIDADIPVAGPNPQAQWQTITGIVSNRLQPRRVQALLLTTFAGSALLLALLGVAGVMAYSVAQRESEIGVRVALGARPERVLRLVLGRALFLAGTGVACGIGGAMITARVLSSQLFGIGPHDPATLAAAAALFLATAVLAAAIPAARALRISPVRALRGE